ncbi:MAG TPA: hypothetical protein EYP53_10005 [Candidatus Latescibacteria bacterium]|nr:hypothetical protein [Candidatus Latescibacterota bacterium]
MSSADREKRGRRLFDRSMAYGQTVFDPEINLCLLRPGTETHTTRESLLYALGLLEGDEQGNITRAQRIIDAVLSTQHLNHESPGYGEYKWNWEDADTKGGGPNTPKFICPPLIHIALQHAHEEECRNFEHFRQRVSSGRLNCRTLGERIYEVRYLGERTSMLIRYDRETGRIIERRRDGACLVPPMFSSPTAKQDRSGQLKVEDAVLHTKNVSALLVVERTGNCYVAINPDLWATPLKLETPYGTLQTESFAFGKIVWKVGNGMKLDIETVYLLEPIYVTKPKETYRVFVNGRDMTDMVKQDEDRLILVQDTR